VQQDNAQRAMAAEAELQGPSLQRPLMHLSSDDLPQILQQDNRNRIEQEQQMQMASQWHHQQLALELLRQQIALELLRQQQDNRSSHVSDLVTRGTLPAQSAHGWPLLQERSSFPAPSNTVVGSASTANSALLAASSVPHAAFMGGFPRRTFHQGLSLLLSRSSFMVPETEMSFRQAETSLGVASIVGNRGDQHVSNSFSALGGYPTPTTQLANLAVGTAEPPMASNEEDKPRARKHAQTPAENPAWSAKRVRENA
jgi:hypothetical protein